jgi:dienelactone hydrolase
MTSLLRASAAAFALLTTVGSANAADIQTVEFNAAPRLVASEAGKPEQAQSDPLKGYLAKPAGAGPFPAVIAMHGCGGLSERFKKEMADRWTGWGYAVLVIDSFANHEIKMTCGVSRDRTRANFRPYDAAGGLSYLATVPFVDIKRVALLGYSQGATASLEIVQQGSEVMTRALGGLQFKAVTAFYPDCYSRFDAVSVPTLILAGEKDDWNPADRCQQMNTRRAQRGATVELVVYPEATHGFDWIDFRPGRRVSGYLMEYNEPAALDSLQKHRAFFDQHLTHVSGAK